MLMEFMEISVSQGASQGKSFLARAFDLVHPGVAPPLRVRPPLDPRLLSTATGNCLTLTLTLTIN